MKRTLSLITAGVLISALLLVLSWYVLYFLAAHFTVFHDPTVMRFQVSGFNLDAIAALQYPLMLITSIITYSVAVVLGPKDGTFWRSVQYIVVGWFIPFILWSILSVLLLFGVRALFYLIETGTLNPSCSTLGEEAVCYQVYQIGGIFLPIWMFDRHVVTILGTLCSTYLLSKYSKATYTNVA